MLKVVYLVENFAMQKWFKSEGHHNMARMQARCVPHMIFASWKNDAPIHKTLQ
jgi:hypothetical protein